MKNESDDDKADIIAQLALSIGFINGCLSGTKLGVLIEDNERSYYIDGRKVSVDEFYKKFARTK